MAWAAATVVVVAPGTVVDVAPFAVVVVDEEDEDVVEAPALSVVVVELGVVGGTLVDPAPGVPGPSVELVVVVPAAVPVVDPPEVVRFTTTRAMTATARRADTT